MEPDTIIAHVSDLALYLGGGEDMVKFNTALLRLMASATWQQQAQLRSAFPHELLAWEVWTAAEEHLTAAQLTERLEKARVVDLSQAAWAARQLSALVSVFAPRRW